MVMAFMTFVVVVMIMVLVSFVVLVGFVCMTVAVVATHMVVRAVMACAKGECKNDSADITGFHFFQFFEKQK